MSRFLHAAAGAARGRLAPFVLAYHGLGHETPEDDPHGLMTTPEAFAEQLDLLQERGYRLVGVPELWAAVQAGTADGLGAITFDDGLADTMHTAATLLGARDAVGTAYLATGLLGLDHPDLPPGRKILSVEEVVALESETIQIGAHSHTHADLATLPASVQLEELVTSRAVLEALLDHPVTTMAYPYGCFDAVTASMAREAGYTLACANDGAGEWAPYAIPREPMFPSTSATRLRLKVSGLYGPAMALRKRIPR